MLGRLVTHWPEIVGKDLADRAQPVKIRYRKVPGSNRPEASLDIASTTSEATLLHYRKDLILERINQIFGERLVTALRFVPVASNAAPSRPRRLLQTPLSPAEKEDLANILEHIRDHELKERLEMLGTSILQDR
jgi:hypothetical protein